MNIHATLQHQAVWIGVWVCLLATSGLFAQQQSTMQDVLYLKDGSVIRGRILEYKDGEFAKIETIGQNIFVFPTDEISYMNLEPAVNHRRTPKAKKEITYKSRGYYNLTQLGLLIRNTEPVYVESQTAAVNLQMINGYRFHRLLQAGLGIGISFFERGYMLPVFADLRGDLLKLPISPHYYVQGGYSAPLYNGEDLYWEEANPEIKGGLLAEAGVGIKINSPGPITWTLTAGYRIQESEHRYIDPWSQARIVESYTHQRLSAQLGIMF